MGENLTARELAPRICPLQATAQSFHRGRRNLAEAQNVKAAAVCFFNLFNTRHMKTRGFTCGLFVGFGEELFAPSKGILFSQNVAKRPRLLRLTKCRRIVYEGEIAAEWSVISFRHVAIYYK